MRDAKRKDFKGRVRDMKKALALERQGFFIRRLLQAYIGQRNDNADCRDDGGDCVDQEHGA